MLMRFREPYEGAIEWDGTDIYKSSLDSFREHVSVMFQKTMIYQTTSEYLRCIAGKAAYHP